LQLVGILVSMITYFFLSKLLGDIGVSYLKPYGGNYFSFILIGVASLAISGYRLMVFQRVLEKV